MALAVSTSETDLDLLTDDAVPVQVAWAAVEQVRAGLELLRSAEIDDVDELKALMGGVEGIVRMAHALGIDLLELSEQLGLHYVDGHTSGNVMSRHVNKLSGAEAAGREKCRRMFAKLPLIADAYRTGRIGRDQVMLLGRVFANPRVRGAMEGRQRRFIKDARRLSFPRFEQRLLDWQRAIDEDGPEPPGERTDKNRTANINQNAFDLSWDLVASFPSVDGMVVNNVHQAYIKALFDLDWAEAKARVGAGVCMADLCRTHAQRKADAWVQICVDAAANTNGMAPVTIDHTIVYSASVYEEMARRFAGGKPRPFDVDDYRCESIDGHSLDPTEAFANSVLNKIRRLVVDAKGVAIDQGRARFFTGLARKAVQITGRECFWPGCWLPATKCEIDHLHDHADGGRTCPGNGAPACGRHNRWREVRLASLRLRAGDRSMVPVS